MLTYNSWSQINFHQSDPSLLTKNETKSFLTAHASLDKMQPHNFVSIRVFNTKKEASKDGLQIFVQP